jgi:hypothetical protein
MSSGILCISTKLTWPLELKERDKMGRTTTPLNWPRFLNWHSSHIDVFKLIEVAYKLLTSVFLVFGAPHILQINYYRKCTAIIITELKELWRELVIVHDKSRYPQSQASVERSNGDSRTTTPLNWPRFLNWHSSHIDVFKLMACKGLKGEQNK